MLVKFGLNQNGRSSLLEAVRFVLLGILAKSHHPSGPLVVPHKSGGRNFLAPGPKAFHAWDRS